MPSLKYCTCTISTAMRHQIMVTVNKTNEWIVCADATRLGGHVGLLKKYRHAPVGGNCLVQTRHNHPVRLRLPPLHRRGIKMCFVGILALCATTALHANDAIDEGDCPIVIPDFDNTMLLTNEERIQMMDQALKDALAQVQDCQQRLSDVQNQNNSNANNPNNAGSVTTSTNSNTEQANNAESGQSDAQNQQTATPSGELSGSEIPDDFNEPANTQIPEDATPSSELSGTEPPKTVQSDNEGTISGSLEDSPSTLPATEDNEQTLSNGKLPEDIPPADNDDIIAKQIREAALAEPDPQKQAKLWNEYRRYKGISERN